MADTRDVVALTQKLIAFDTVNPPGQEAACIRFCAELLQTAGFDCRIIDHGNDRCGLIATRGDRPGLCFSGHLDTVPLGRSRWLYAPLGGSVVDGRLYGRGSSDMKGGVAAFLTAASTTQAPASVILTSGEETGCDGARWLVEKGSLPKAGAMVVGESTDNQPVPGHKGALWLRLTTTGRTAHGATPEQGENAIARMAETLARLCRYRPRHTHPLMGQASCNIGTLQAGINPNSVPDLCALTADLRSVAGVTHDTLAEEVRALCDSEVDIKRLIDLPAVWTDPDDPWFAAACQQVCAMTEHAAHRACVNYFTDASVLKPAMGDLPVMILGPGQVDQPHVTDEYVRVARLVEAVGLYAALIDASA